MHKNQMKTLISNKIRYHLFKNKKINLYLVKILTLK